MYESMGKKYKNYIYRIEKLCGAEKEYMVTFRYDKRKEAIKMILDKAVLKGVKSMFINRVEYKGKEITLFTSGKAIIKNVSNDEELENLLEDLLG